MCWMLPKFWSFPKSRNGKNRTELGKIHLEGTDPSSALSGREIPVGIAFGIKVRDYRGSKLIQELKPGAAGKGKNREQEAIPDLCQGLGRGISPENRENVENTEGERGISPS